MSYIKNITDGLGTAATGMKFTLKHLFSPNVTVQYPNTNPYTEISAVDKIPDRARNRLLLDPDICNGCTSCARACPVDCIEIDTVKVIANDPDQPTLSDGTKRRLWLAKYDINFAQCCFCGLCAAACPTEALKHTTVFDYCTYDVNDLLYHFSTMTPEQIAEKKKLLADEVKAKAAAAAAAKSEN